MLAPTKKDMVPFAGIEVVAVSIRLERVVILIALKRRLVLVELDKTMEEIWWRQ